MITLRIYKVTENIDLAQADAIYHLVRAPSAAQAIRHIVAPRFTAELATQEELVALVSDGVKVRESTA